MRVLPKIQEIDDIKTKNTQENYIHKSPPRHKKGDKMKIIIKKGKSSRTFFDKKEKKRLDSVFSIINLPGFPSTKLDNICNRKIRKEKNILQEKSPNQWGGNDFSKFISSHPTCEPWC